MDSAAMVEVQRFVAADMQVLTAEQAQRSVIDRTEVVAPDKHAAEQVKR